MKNKDNRSGQTLHITSSQTELLRQRAEQIIWEKAIPSTVSMDALSPIEMEQALHELRVHQVELEMQNEELRRVQVELDAVRERYFDLYDLAPVGYLTLSKKGLVLEANLAAAMLLNVTRNDLLRQPLSQFIYRDDQDIYYMHRKRLFTTGDPQTCELRMVKKGHGTTLWGHLAATAAIEENQPVCRIVISDITRLKEEDAYRKRLQAQLNQAQKMESVGQLAGGVAHDFNNMLSVIIGHTELAMQEMDPSQQLFVDLTEIQKAAHRSADLTRQLMAFARKQTVAPVVLDMNETVESMLVMLRRLIGEDIELVWLPGAEVWPIKVDPSQIDQILANLMVNARDAIGSVGKIIIKTTIAVIDKVWAMKHPGLIPGEYVLLSVGDNGCGMEKEIQDKLFEPFFTTKDVGKGTGLGLSTVYGIVKQNNGFIDVYSEPNKGTIFKIYLPRHTLKTPASHKNEKSSLEVKSFCLETILLVEDEPVILKLTTRMLRKQGYIILGAATPDQAISIAREHNDKIHLLITDVVMPKMNGRDLAKKILTIHPNLKCLFMSGYTADVIASHGVLNEDLHFIQKPFSIKGLTDKVCQLLKSNSQSSQNAHGPGRLPA